MRHLLTPVSFGVGALGVGILLGIAMERANVIAADQRVGEDLKRNGSSQYDASMLSGVLQRRSVTEANALSEVLRASDPLEASLSFARLVLQLPSEEFEEFARLLWNTPGDSREMTERRRLLIERWGKVDGPAAIEFAKARSGPDKIAAISAALVGWASANSMAAREWIASRSDGAERQLYDYSLVAGLARYDLEEASSYVLRLGEGRQSDRMMRLVAGEYLRRNRGEAISWLEQLPNGTLRDTAVQEVTRRLARADGRTALDWIGRLSDPDEIRQAMTEAVGIWTRYDPRAASVYLSEMALGLARDHAVSAFSRASAAENPEASTAWAETIGNADLREACLAELQGQ